MSPIIYSIGTSTRPLQEFISLIKAFGIEVAIDVRSFPVSRFPHFSRESLEKSLPQEGIQYYYLGKELGGFRKGGYEAHRRSELFKKGIKELEMMGEQRKCVFFCSERFPWRCHRRWIAEELKERGWEVIHILEEGKIWIQKW